LPLFLRPRDGNLKNNVNCTAIRISFYGGAVIFDSQDGRNFQDDYGEDQDRNPEILFHDACF
jgi:hypothetical protein